MHSMMVGQPLNEVTGAFAREQAGLADGGAPAGVARGRDDPAQRGAARRARSGNDALCRADGGTASRSSTGAVPPVLLPPVGRRGAAAPRADWARRPTGRRFSQHKPDGSLTRRRRTASPLPSSPTRGAPSPAASASSPRPSPEARAAQLQLGLDPPDVNADGTEAPADARHSPAERGPAATGREAATVLAISLPHVARASAHRQRLPGRPRRRLGLRAHHD
jgi:hypothetical protein